MNNLLNNFSKNARHFLLAIVCFLMTAGIFSCSKNEGVIEPSQQPMATDDASLLAWQMAKWPATRSSSNLIGTLVTTGDSIQIKFIRTGSVTINWGDGNIQDYASSQNTFYKYNDGAPAHSIFIYGEENIINHVYASNQNLIYADFSHYDWLRTLWLDFNRLTDINLKYNTNLSRINLSQNKLKSLDISNLFKINELCIDYNQIQNISVAHLGNALLGLYIEGTQITDLDITQNKELGALRIDNLTIHNLDLTQNTKLNYIDMNGFSGTTIDFRLFPDLSQLRARRTEIKILDLSNNPNISDLIIADSQVETMILPDSWNMISGLDVRNTPIEKSSRKITSIALALPDRTGETHPGYFNTDSPFKENFRADLEDYNWFMN